MRDSGADFLIQLIPLFTMWIIFAIPAYWIAKRKGVSKMGFAFGIFPLWAWMFAIWLVSLTDKVVLERLERLEGKG